MPSPTTRRSAGRAFLNLLWRQALLAVPFGLFFGVLNGDHTPGQFLFSYRLCLYFTYTIALTLWVIDHVLLPRVPLLSDAIGFGRVWRATLLYGVSSIAAAFGAALLIQATLLPGFLGTGRSVLTLFMFALLFSVLFMGLAYAMFYYRRSLDRARADEELKLARRIQRSFLLSEFPHMSRLEVHAVNVSSRQVSGDFYDVVPAGDGAFLIAIADVAGKGVPAALMTSMLQASLRTQAGSEPSVAAILRNINSLIYRSTSVNQFATFFLARIEEDRLRLSYSNAGHNHPIVFRRDGGRIALERGGTVVGILESAEFEEDAIELRPGDRVILYTDGISEAADARGEMFGEERLIELVDRLPPDLPACDATGRILDSVRGFLDGAEAGDDMTIMVLRALELAGRDDTPALAAGSAARRP